VRTKDKGREREEANNVSGSGAVEMEGKGKL
jgi:hypothetical protein